MNNFRSRRIGSLILFVSFILNVPLHAQIFTKTDVGAKVIVNATEIDIQFYSPTIVRVIKSPTGISFTKQSLSVVKAPEKMALSAVQKNNKLLVSSKMVKVSIDMRSGSVVFSDGSGKALLNEKPSGASFTDFDDAGTKTCSVTQAFALDKEEAIYGLGQQQKGNLVQRNQRMNMVQGNTDDYVPFFVSTKGYGLFWDNYSPTIFTDNADSTSFKSDIGDCIDYYFIYGKNMDGTISGMRDLTGQVPMFPLWTFGYWQSKERYKTQDEVVGVVQKYRELKVPIDGIIQDWQYWGNNYLWNAMDFLNADFYDGPKMVTDVHNLNAHMIISIWSSFGPQTKQYKELNDINALLNFKTWPESGVDKWPPNKDYPSGVRVYDPFNPAARAIYWKYLSKGLLSTGIDGWWMDSTEPDNFDSKPSTTFLGSYRKVRNAFPLMTVGGVYDNQRKVSSDKRVFILTRSAFAGQQRYGAQTWSGDVNSSWQSLRNQIPAGLNFSLSGIPYWNCDIGGFFAGSYNRNRSNVSGSKNPLYQELYVRWLQFGAFTPMMRSHGTDIPREIYNFGKKGEPIYNAIEKTINLRYSLLPYIYSTAWQVTHAQSTFMRALVMDFNDNKVRDINHEYMFGKSILVCPVVNAQYTPETMVKTDENTGWNKDSAMAAKNVSVDFTQAKSEKVYLPQGTDWYDFWTNQNYKGGQDIEYTTSIDKIPLFIKAGSIVPYGPQVQFATEKKWDNLEIRVYEGADGSFTLYEDENDNYNYEKNVLSTINFQWNNTKKMLTISDRSGSFPGMLTERKFTIVKIAAGKDVDSNANVVGTKEIIYKGNKVTVKL
jgi:alpha-D-xyloside xylohydrolase